MCGRCRDSLDDALADIGRLYATLPGLLPPSQGSQDGGGGKRTKVDAAPLPLRGDVLNLLGPAAEVHTADAGDMACQGGPLPTLVVLESWVRLVSEERSFASRTDAATVPNCVAFLRRNLDWVCHQGWVPDFAGEIRDAHAVLKTVCGEHRPHPIGACPECETTLYASTYSDTITCRSCHAEWPREQWKIMGQAMGVIAG